MLYIEHVIARLFKGRHYWRNVSFDEIAELYASRLLTMVAVNVIGIFVAIYLYKLGYSVFFIALLYGCLYLFRALFSPLSAMLAAYIGPKHGILASNSIRIGSMLAFSFAPEFGISAVILFGILQQIAGSIYVTCYTIEFSKVRHIDHTGKELGTMHMVEQAAKLISPFLGGVIATLFSPQATTIVASVLLIIAAVPLLRRVEPTVTRSKLRWRGFPWRMALPSLTSQTVIGFDFVASGMAWSLFLALFIFASMGDGVYAILGGLASISVVVSIIAAWTFGKLIDRHKGDMLLIAGTIMNMVLHLFRPFASTPAGAMGTNIVNETATAAYTLPFTRVVFEAADRSGYRTAYAMYAEIVSDVSAALACFALATFVSFFGVHNGLQAIFIFAAVFQMLMLVSTRAAR